MNLQELYDKLERHDWFYEGSDDHSVWQRGKQKEAELNVLARSVDGGKELMEAFGRHHFSGEPWNTVKQPKPVRPS